MVPDDPEELEYHLFARIVKLRRRESSTNGIILCTDIVCEVSIPCAYTGTARSN